MLQYHLNEADYLAHHMFADGQSARNRKRRLVRRLVIPVLYIVFGLFFLLGAYYEIAFFFLVVALIWFFAHPAYSKWIHKRYYSKFIRDNYVNRINTEINLSLGNEELVLKDPGNEVRIKTPELERLDETKEHYFLRTKSASVIVLPKQNIKDQETLNRMIVFLKDDLLIPYYDQQNWSWK